MEAPTLSGEKTIKPKEKTVESRKEKKTQTQRRRQFSCGMEVVHKDGLHQEERDIEDNKIS